MRIPYKESSYPVLIAIITDITEITEKNNQLQMLMNHIVGGVLLAEIEDDIQIKYISPSFYAFSGHTVAETGPKGENLFSLIHPDDRQPLKKYLREAITNNKILDHVFRSVTADGKIFWRHIRAVRMADDGSQTVKVIAIITDVTNLNESLIRLQSIISHIPEGVAVYEINDKWHTIYINDMLLEIMGCSRQYYEDNFKDNAIAIICPEDLAGLQKEVSSALKEDRNVNYTCKIKKQNSDDPCYCLIRGVKIGECQQNPICLAIILDITAQKQLEQNLLISEERLRITLDKIDASLWEVDIPNQKVIHIAGNHICADKTIDIKEKNHQAILDEAWIHADSTADFKRMISCIYAGEPEGTFKLRIKHRDGRFLWTNNIFTMIYDEKGQPYRALIIAEPLPNINLDLSFFEQEEALYLAMENMLLCVAKINLSQNIVELFHIADSSDYQAKNIKTYDDLLQISMSMAATPDDSHKISAQMSTQNLMSAFEHGGNFIVVQYKQNNAQGQIKWVSNIINLLKDPISGDLYAFSYLRDIDKRKRHELALPQRIERDINTYLYSAETTKHLVNYIISQNKGSDKLCALTIMNLSGLEQMKKEMGIGAASGTITSISRLIRIISDSNMIIGYLGEADFVFFMEDVASAEYIFDIIKELTEKIIAIHKHKNFIERLNPVFGIDILPMADASYKLLLQHAFQACRQTEEKATEKRIGLYSHEDQPEQNEYQKQTGPDGGQNPLASGLPDTTMLDDLTGAGNRQSYIAAISQCNPDAISSLGILFTDINGLSKFNSDYGNEYGDKILIFKANILQKHFPGSVYRVSGDEFIVFALNLSQKEFRKRTKAVKKAFNEVYPGYISVGITWANQHININKLIQHAEDIMHIEKQDYYNMKERGGHKQRNQLIKQLQKDIQDQNFLLYLQPQLDLRCNKICGAEALVRLHNEEKGLVMPGSFIPGLEKENLIKYLDFYMLDQALSVLSRWKKEGRRLLPIAVNFSRLTLIAPNTFENVMEICHKYDLPRDLIKIEITESIGHVERITATNVCERLSQAGFKIALDDFGSEYSSLYILSTIHFDEVKIDKNITSDIISNKLSQLTVSNTRQFCQVCDSLCLAEGVETEEQLHMLKNLDCDMAQGYLFDKPIPVAEFEKQYLPLDQTDQQ